MKDADEHVDGKTQEERGIEAIRAVSNLFAAERYLFDAQNRVRQLAEVMNTTPERLEEIVLGLLGPSGTTRVTPRATMADTAIATLVRVFAEFDTNGHMICGADCQCLAPLRAAVKALEKP